MGKKGKRGGKKKMQQSAQSEQPLQLEEPTGTEHHDEETGQHGEADWDGCEECRAAAQHHDCNGSAAHLSQYENGDESALESGQANGHISFPLNLTAAHDYDSERDAFTGALNHSHVDTSCGQEKIRTTANHPENGDTQIDTDAQPTGSATNANTTPIFVHYGNHSDSHPRLRTKYDIDYEIEIIQLQKQRTTLKMRHARQELTLGEKMIQLQEMELALRRQQSQQSDSRATQS